jgi:ketosteroid isomerase-like protein
MPEEEINSLQRVYTAVQRGESDELRQSLTHDIEFILPDALPWGGTHHGHLGITAVTDRYEDLVDGLWADPDEFVETGDRILVLGRISGRARSSGQSFEVPFAHVWGMTDGMPSSFRGYFDTAPITAALQAGG